MVLKSLRRTAFCTSGILALAACAPTSGRIVYSELPAGPGKVERAVADAEAGAIPVDVPRTRIVVARIDEVPGTRPPDGSVRVVVRPTDNTPPFAFHVQAGAVPIESGRVLSLAPRRTFTDRTDLKVTYFEGTLVPKAIGTETVDLAKTRIQQIGAAVSAVIPLFPLSDAAQVQSVRTTTPEPPLLPPFSFEITTRASLTVSDHPVSDTPVGKRWTYGLSLVPLPGQQTSEPAASITYADLLGTFRPDRDHGFYPVTVCRDVRLTIKYKENDEVGGREVYSAIIRVADPDRVRLVPLPAKGSLNFHGVCGVDTVDGTRAEPDHFGTIEALARQAKVIMDATKPKDPPKGQ